MSKTAAFKLKPFCLVKREDLHKKSVKQDLTMKWEPIFRLTEQSSLCEIPQQVDASFAQSFLAGTQVSEVKCYIWVKADESFLSTWSIGTWSWKV